MTGEEFLRKLKAELSLTVSEQVIREQLEYYGGYIREEIAKGRSEEEVLSELEEPRLLARTITDAAEASGDAVARETPFRYTEEEINYNSDEEDLKYQGAHEDEEPLYAEREGFFRQRTEQEQTSGRAYDPYGGQTVENTEESRRNGAEHSPFGRVYQTGGAGCLAAGLVLFVVLYLLALLIGGIFQLLSPILLPLMIVGVLLWFMKAMMGR